MGQARSSALILLDAVAQTTLGELDHDDPDDATLAAVLVELRVVVAELLARLKGSAA